MRWLEPVPVAAVGVVALVAALLLPWARYGGIAVRVFEIPGWQWYLATALAQQAAVVAILLNRLAGQRLVLLVAGLALGGAAAVLAVVILAAGQAPSNVFGPVIPLVAPALGGGGPAALMAAVAGVAALARFRSLVAQPEDAAPR